MAKKKTVHERWAVVAVHRKDKQVFSLSYTKRDAIKEFNKNDWRPWRHWYKVGFRCMKVKVVIEEAR